MQKRIRGCVAEKNLVTCIGIASDHTLCPSNFSLIPFGSSKSTSDTYDQYIYSHTSNSVMETFKLWIRSSRVNLTRCSKYRTGRLKNYSPGFRPRSLAVPSNDRRIYIVLQCLHILAVGNKTLGEINCPENKFASAERAVVSVTSFFCLIVPSARRVWTKNPSPSFAGKNRSKYLEGNKETADNSATKHHVELT